MELRQRKVKLSGNDQLAKDEEKLNEAKAGEGPYTDYMLQFLLLLILATPWLVLMLVPLANLGLEGVMKSKVRGRPYQPEDFGQELYESLFIPHAMETSYLSSRKFWITLAALSVPHVFYFFVWTNSQKFYNFASRYLSFLGEPYQAFAILAHGIKLFQTLAIVLWYATPEWIMEQSFFTLLPTIKEAFQRLYLCQALLGIELFLLGQLFNGAVYSTIGEAGVYYGCRLGKTIPWVYGFPFSVVPHPQYLGATLSIWGGCVLLATLYHVHEGLYGIAAAMAVFYSFSSYVEANL